MPRILLVRVASPKQAFVLFGGGYFIFPAEQPAGASWRLRRAPPILQRPLRQGCVYTRMYDVIHSEQVWLQTLLHAQL